MCLHAEFLVQQIRHYLRRQLHLLPVQVAGLCRSAKWELYLYGGLFIKVDSDSVDCCPGVCLCFGSHPTWQRVTHHLWFVPAFERGMGMSMPWQFQSRVGCTAGRPCGSFTPYGAVPGVTG